jgi:hypothetical protein
MKDLLQSNKKGVSVMIGYVLLIVIAIGLSIAVFAYLKLYLPKDKPKCFEDVVLTVDELDCADGWVNITLTNRGFFSAQGVFLRIGQGGRVFKEVLNKEDNYIFFGDTSGQLEPGESWSRNYECGPEPEGVGCNDGAFEFEIEPFIYIENEPAVCEEAVINRLIQCF